VTKVIGQILNSNSLEFARVKKDFGIHGVFSGEIVGFQKPYYQVVYSDEDIEDYRFTDVLKLIDLDYFNGDHDDGEGEDEDEEKRGMEASSGDEGGNVAVDGEAQDKEPEEQEEQEVTILTRDECEDNDILKLQEIMLSKLYDQRNSSSRFNKVNNGKDVDKLAALKILQYIEEHHLSVVEANEYLQYNHELIEHVTGKPFNMVKSYKTLKRVFLLELDKLIPLCEVTVDLPKEFFHDIVGKNNRHLPSLKAVHIPLEAAIAILLLKMSPDDIVSDMKPQYWRGTIEEEDSVERLYTNWCSGKYACDIQRFVRSWWDTRHIPLVLYVSIFVDGGIMSSSQKRSATPVSIAIQNVRNEKFQSLIGFVPEEGCVSNEILEGLLDEHGINKTGRKFIMQHTHRQREWDYLCSTFTPFLNRQANRNGFDVQIGTGANKKFYRIYVQFTNFLGDSPQLHSLAGVCKNACHVCMCKNFSNFRIDGHGENGQRASILEQEVPRDIDTQIKTGLAHLKVMSSFIKREEGANTRESQQKRVKTVQLLRTINGYSGHNKVMSIFRPLINEGNIHFV